MNTTVRYKFTTGVLISPFPDQDGNKLQWPNCNFCKSHKKNSESCPSNKVSAAGMTCASVKKWWLFKFFFFQSCRAKDLSTRLYLLSLQKIVPWYLHVYSATLKAVLQFWIIDWHQNDDQNIFDDSQVLYFLCWVQMSFEASGSGRYHLLDRNTYYRILLKLVWHILVAIRPE